MQLCNNLTAPLLPAFKHKLGIWIGLTFCSSGAHTLAHTLTLESRKTKASNSATRKLLCDVGIKEPDRYPPIRQQGSYYRQHIWVSWIDRKLLIIYLVIIAFLVPRKGRSVCSIFSLVPKVALGNTHLRVGGWRDAFLCSSKMFLLQTVRTVRVDYGPKQGDSDLTLGKALW